MESLESLLPILLWGGLFFLMMRFGCGAHIMGHGHGKGHDHSGHGKKPAEASPSAQKVEFVWTPPDEDVDLVCGKTVDPKAARSSVFNGWVYYFCSSDCRDAFEAAPDSFLAPKGVGSPSMPPQRLEDHREDRHSHA